MLPAQAEADDKEAAAAPKRAKKSGKAEKKTPADDDAEPTKDEVKMETLIKKGRAALDKVREQPQHRAVSGVFDSELAFRLPAPSMLVMTTVLSGVCPRAQCDGSLRASPRGT